MSLKLGTWAVRARPIRPAHWLAVLLLVCPACSGDGGTAPEDDRVVRVDVTPASVTFQRPGQTAQLTATPRNARGAPVADRAVTWSSSDTTTATVSQSGLVTAVAAGSVTVTAHVGGSSGAATVEVLEALTEDVATVPPTGGTFSLLNGLVTLEVPAGALATATEITVRAVDPDPGSDWPVAHARYEFGPNGLSFTEPALLTLIYDPKAVSAGVDVGLLRLHRFSAGAAELVLASRHDSTSATVRGWIDGFSSYGAADASIDDLIANLEEMALRQASGTSVEDIEEAMREDMSVIFSRENAACTATLSLADKKSRVQRLLIVMTIAQSTGIGLDVVGEMNDLCGGILDSEATKLVVEPGGDVRLKPGETRQLKATVQASDGREFVGALEWVSSDASVASVTQDGHATGGGTGVANVVVSSVDFPSIAALARLIVAPDLLVELLPADLHLRMGQDGTFGTLVHDTTTGDVIDAFPIDWTVHDTDILTAIDFAFDTRATATLRPLLPGETMVTACVAGLDEHSCASAAVTVAYSVQGVWDYHETVTVNLPPPESETCSISGRMWITQLGYTYSGTATETATCTFSLGNGTPPSSHTVTATGEIYDGQVVDNAATHMSTFTSSSGGETCRATGKLESTDGFATRATGRIECVDSEGYYSAGPSIADWIDDLSGS